MWQRHDYMGTLWAFIGITLIFVSIRVYVRLTSVHRPWREILVVLAWILFLLYGVGETILYYRYQNYRQLVDTDHPPWDYMTDVEIEWSWKIYFIEDFTYPQAVNCCKAVLLLTYQDLCPRRLFPRIWGLIIFGYVVLLCHQVGIFFIYEFVECAPQPLSTIWRPDLSRSLNGPSLSCVGRYPGFMATEWSVALATDILFYVIPIFIVYQLQNLTIVQRSGVACMFCTGFVHAGFTAWYIYASFAPTDERATPAGQGRLVFAQIFIPASAIMVVCIPQLRLFGRWGFIRSIGSVVSATIHEIGPKEDALPVTSPSPRATVTTPGSDVTCEGAKDTPIDEEKGGAAISQAGPRTDVDSPRLHTT